MKIEIEQDQITLFLKKEEIEDFHFEDIEEVEDYFRTLFSKLEEYYQITIEGFYNISVFLDKAEGMILKLEKEDIDYYHFHQIEMRIVKEDTVFFYYLNDILDFLDSDVDIYFYKNEFYIKNNNPKKVYNLYEFGKIIYENTDIILKKGLLFTQE